MNQWAIVGLGFTVGGLIGLTGVGGGVLMTPVLILFFGVQPSTAIGTDLVYAALTKLTGAIKHWRQGTVELKLAAVLSAGSLPTSLCGIFVAASVKKTLGRAVEPVITAALAWVCILVAVMMVFHILADRGALLGGGKGLGLSGRGLQISTFILGVVTGVLVGLTSIGAGTIVMIFLTMLYRMPARQLVGTDLVHAAVLASVSALGHLWAGNVDLSLAGTLLLGSIPGVILGSRMSVRIPEAVLRVSIALIMAFSGMRLLVQ